MRAKKRQMRKEKKMRAECGRCKKEARLEARAKDLNREDNQNPWVPYCLGCLAEAVGEQELDVQRVGQKK